MTGDSQDGSPQTVDESLFARWRCLATTRALCHGDSPMLGPEGTNELLVGPFHTHHLEECKADLFAGTDRLFLSVGCKVQEQAPLSPMRPTSKAPIPVSCEDLNVLRAALDCWCYFLDLRGYTAQRSLLCALSTIKYTAVGEGT